MSTAAEPLHLFQAKLDSRYVLRLARDHGLPREADFGYLLHCLLGELFGREAPKPFTFRDLDADLLEILGYGRAGRERLLEIVAESAAPEAARLLGDRVETKEISPTLWREGKRLAFRARVCPVVRQRPGGERKRHREVDVYLARLDAAKAAGTPEPEREQVYADWLREQFEGEGAARLVEARMLQFQRALLWRRRHAEAGAGRRIERPEAHFEGLLEVRDGAAFQRLLARGLGRHRAFGFGMLLLRPV